MTDIDYGDMPASVVVVTEHSQLHEYYGLSIRDYLIGQALAGTAALPADNRGPERPAVIARRAIGIADAVINQIEERIEGDRSDGE